MILKEGVSVLGVKPSTSIAMAVVDSVVFRELGHEATFTRVCDGAADQVAGSLHPHGYAFDLRTWDIQAPKGTQLHEDTKQGLAQAIRDALGPEWHVVVKDTHIHVEHEAAKVLLWPAQYKEAA